MRAGFDGTILAEWPRWRVYWIRTCDGALLLVGGFGANSISRSRQAEASAGNDRGAREYRAPRRCGNCRKLLLH